MAIDLSKYKLKTAPPAAPIAPASVAPFAPAPAAPIITPTAKPAINLDKYKLPSAAPAPAAPGRFTQAFNSVVNAKIPMATPVIGPALGTISKFNPEGIGNTVKEAFKSGVDYAKGGVQQFKEGKSTKDKIRGVGKILYGAGGAIGAPVAPLFKPLSDAMNYVADKAGDSEKLQKFATSEKGEKAINTAEDIQNAAGIAGFFEGFAALKPFRSRPKVLETTPGVSTPKIPEPPTGGPKAGTGTPKTTANLADPKFVGLSTEFSKANVNPQVKSSFQRLSNLPNEDVLQRYSNSFDQAERAKANIKEDMPISKTGEILGNEFDKLAQRRRDIGKTLGEEIKNNIGNEKIDLQEVQSNFAQKLESEANVIFENGELKSTTRQSALTKQGKSQLSEYMKELEELGPNPTAGDIDAFVRRVGDQLDLYKGENNVFGTSNVERLIKSSLNDLRETMNPSKNPKFETYYNTKKEYADLSKFLEEGEGIVGKKTQSGDYAKDASALKSAVQSLLNNGKKDWLIKFEEYTGVPILDYATIDLQAMKDAGITQGRSLLEIFNPESKTSIPLSKEGIINKVIEKGVDAAKRAFVGSPKEQTIRVIKSYDPKISSFNMKKVNQIIEERRSKASEAKPFLDDLSKTIAEKNGASVATADIKLGKRMLDKAIRDGNKRVNHLYNQTDIARNSIVAESSKHKQIIDDLVKTGKVEGDPIPQTREKYHGYEGNRILIKTPNGHIAEIQVLSPRMIVAKMSPESAIKILGKEPYDAIVSKLPPGVEPGIGHKLYEKLQEAITSGVEELYDKAVKVHKEYYSNFY